METPPRYTQMINKQVKRLLINIINYRCDVYSMQQMFTCSLHTKMCTLYFRIGIRPRLGRIDVSLLGVSLALC